MSLLMTDDVLSISTREAADRLDDLVLRAQSGDRVVLTRDGAAVAEIVAADERPEAPSDTKKPVSSLLGSMKGKIWISDDFDTPDDVWGDLFK